MNARTRNIYISSIFILVRLALAIRILSTGSVLSWYFGIAELIVLATTILALRKGVIDASIAGLLVPFAYMYPLLLDTASTGNVDKIAGTVFGLLFALQLATRTYLADCCTIGVPVYVAIRTKGPYAYVRHPLTVIECLQVITIVLAVPTTANLVIGAAAICAYVVAALVEERHLRSQPDYVAYTHVVPSRLIPGVW